MSFRRESLHQASGQARAAHEIDLTPGEWDEVALGKPIAKGEAWHAIVGFWVLATLLFAIVVATPVLEAVARRLT